MWVHELEAADATCGGKALGLARLRRAGLPIPDGFVLDDHAFQYAVGELEITSTDDIGHVLDEAARRIASVELPTELVDEVERRAAALGIVAVRSSATLEDGAAGAAAGVFASQVGVPATNVWAAIRAVWTSALTPLAATYARRRGGALAIGVIIQRHVEGARITVYTRPPGAPDEDVVLIQRDTELVRRPRQAPSVEDADARAAALGIAAETAIGATTGADVELIDDVLVQARPIVHPVVHPRTPAPPAVTAALVADGRRWTWDVAHNPDPLSVAQTELVDAVERARVASWESRVCAGFLYTSARPGITAPPPTFERATLEPRLVEIEHRLADLLAPPTTTIADAVARYVQCYAIWAGELSPTIAVARAALHDAPAGGRRPSSVEALLVAAARGELSTDELMSRIGVLAPAWDIATPTYAERPEVVNAAIARARAAAPTTTATGELDVAAELADRDDLWFARAQWLVRRAVLARATALAIDPDDAFWVPFAILDEGIAAEDARRRAAAARAAAHRAASWDVPRTVGGPPADAAQSLRGVGTGPRVTGRVRRFANLGSAIVVGAGDIVVTRAVTPALAVVVIGCAALVSETGGLLDHGAALARELGIPCVVGCHDAWHLLADGALVTVDGTAGTVELVEPT